MDEDSGLVKKYIEGDEYAAEELVVKYQRKTYALIYRMTGDTEEAKDLTQKTFINALKNIKGFGGRSSFGTWLYKIALNSCLDHLKRKRPETVSINEAAAPDGDKGALSSLIEKERRLLVAGSLMGLTERQRAAVVLRAYEGMSITETAQAMGLSEGAVKAHYHNGIKRLRELLKEKGHEINS